MSYFMSLLKVLGSFVDKAVPFAVGARTKIAVVACPILNSPVVPALLAAIPGGAVALPILPFVTAVLCASAPLFALAGLVRDPVAK